MVARHDAPPAVEVVSVRLIGQDPEPGTGDAASKPAMFGSCSVPLALLLSRRSRHLLSALRAERVES